LRLSMLGKMCKRIVGIKKALKIFTERALQPATTEGWVRYSQHFTKTENPLWETDKFPPDLQDNFITLLSAKKIRKQCRLKAAYH